MTSEIKEAKSFLSDAEESAGTSNGRVLNHLAQTHALIAVAEQLRIANLVQLMIVSADTTCIDAIYTTVQGGRWKLRPGIAEALGIEES